MKKIIYIMRGCLLFWAVVAFMLFEKPVEARDYRIIGGKVASKSDWRWVAHLIAAEDHLLYRGHICAGALVDPYWVITTAHCVENIRGNFMRPEEIHVVFDAHDLINDTGERIPIKRIVPNPTYQMHRKWDCDMALLELESPASVPVIGFIEPEINLNGSWAVVVGWGTTSPIDLTYPDQLMEARVPIVSNETCNRSYNREGFYNNPITECMLCAGLEQGGVDSCLDDSGGPLMVQHNNQWKLAGLVSWGDGCAQPGYYGVYTRVSSLLDFIYTHIPPLPPIAVEDTYMVSIGKSLIVPAPGVLSNDTGTPGRTLTAHPVTAPVHGELELHQNGSFSYTYYGTLPGSDVFTYQTGDGEEMSSPAAVNLIIHETSTRKIKLLDNANCFISTCLSGTDQK